MLRVLEIPQGPFDNGCQKNDDAQVRNEVNEQRHLTLLSNTSPEEIGSLK